MSSEIPINEQNEMEYRIVNQTIDFAIRLHSNIDEVDNLVALRDIAFNKEGLA